MDRFLVKRKKKEDQNKSDHAPASKKALFAMSKLDISQCVYFLPHNHTHTQSHTLELQRIHVFRFIVNTWLKKIRRVQISETEYNEQLYKR